MLKKYTYLICLIMPIIILLGWTFSLSSAQKDGTEIVLVVKGYDPRDLLSGHYLLLTPDWQATDCGQFAEGQCPKQDFLKIYKYYIPEEKAELLEQILQNAKEVTAALVFATNKREGYVIRDLRLNNMPWQQWLEANHHEQNRKK